MREVAAGKGEKAGQKMGAGSERRQRAKEREVSCPTDRRWFQ